MRAKIDGLEENARFEAASRPPRAARARGPGDLMEPVGQDLMEPVDGWSL